MTECEFCRLVEKGHKVYDDDKCAVVLHPSPASRGHMLVLSKEHFTIFEQVNDFLVEHMAKVANRASIALFDAVQAQGTNLIIMNGTAAGQKIPHFAINVIPRFPNDGLNFAWQPRQISEEMMSTVELQLKEDSKKVGDFEKEKKEPIKEQAAVKLEQKEEDYLISHLRRIP